MTPVNGQRNFNINFFRGTFGVETAGFPNGPFWDDLETNISCRCSGGIFGVKKTGRTKRAILG